MKIAVANWTAKRAGGIESYLEAILSGLRERGHDVFFWHERREPSDREPIDGVNDGSHACAADGESAFAALATWRPDVVFVHRLDDLANEERLLALAPGVFFAHAYYGTCISGTKTFQLPVIQPCDREFGPQCLVNYFPRRCGGLSPVTMLTEYRRQSNRLELLRRYRGLVMFSDHMRREYEKHGFAASRLYRVPAVNPLAASGVDSSPPIVRDPAGPIHLAFVGRMDLLKGCRVLLRALPLVQSALARPVRLTVAGAGPDLDACRALAQEIAGHSADVGVTFLGWSSREQCEDLLSETDVLVVPSLWPEPFGLVGIEALSRGVPVAAFAVGGIPEWLEDGVTGALAPADPPAPAGLANAIVRCLAADVREHARSCAAEQLRRYSVARHLDALTSVLQDARSATFAGANAEAVTQ